MENKVLVLSYFFPPKATTGAIRVKNICDFLLTKGMTPIVVAGDWQRKEAVGASGKWESGTIANTESGYPVFYEADRRSLRLILFKLFDRPFIRRIYSSFLSPFLQFVELQFPLLLFYSNMYRRAAAILKNDPSIKMVFISIGPFPQAAFGYRLKRKFPYINWIADYRDDWSTSDVNNFAFFGLERHVIRYYERKYLSNSSAFCSVSDAYVYKIGKAIRKAGFLLANGFDELVAARAAAFDNSLYPDFTITFNGTLYETQPVEMVLEALSHLWANGYAIYIRFVGTGIHPSQKDRILKKAGPYSSFVEVTERVPREVVLDTQLKSHLLLAIGHVGLKGVVGSKTYEYIGLRKKVLLVPSDHDIIEALLTKTKQAYVCNTVEACIATLKVIWSEYKNGRFETMVYYDGYTQYSRNYMMEKLAEMSSAM